MAITLAFGIQKGGCSKTSTCGIVAHLLRKDGYRVLAVDMDCQGNLTELLSGRSCRDFEKNTVLQALDENNAKKYIYRVNENLDLLPADNMLANLPRQLYQKFGFTSNVIYMQLRYNLQEISDDYDFIVIDTPPALGEPTINAMVAADYAVVMYESSQWCYSAIPNFMGTVEVAKSMNPELKIAGILRTLNDVRRYDSKDFNEMIEEEYPDEVFQTVIKRKAATGRIPLYGFENNKELNEAVDQFVPFYEELMKCVKV